MSDCCILDVFRRLVGGTCPSDVWIVPTVGPVREQSGATQPTWRYQRWPLLGRTIMAMTLTDSQMVTLSVAFVDRKGNPAPVDGVPQWFVDSPAVLALTPAADGLSCVASAVGPLGAAKVSVKADADLGAGVTEIAGVLDFSVVAGAAATVTITAGTPVEQP